MSGYLRSLAARAVTPGPRLRPVAMPFAQSMATPERLEQDAEIAAASSAADRLAPQASSTLADTAPRHDDSSARAPLTAAEAIVLIATTPAYSRQTPSRRESERGVDAPPDRYERASADDLIAALPRPDADRDSRPSRDRASVLDGSARLRPIAVNTPAQAPSGPSRMTERRAEAAGSRADSPADVHIHIGRIELTAVTAPAPPRRQAAAVKTAMPLDEYLRRRNGGAR